MPKQRSINIVIRDHGSESIYVKVAYEGEEVVKEDCDITLELTSKRLLEILLEHNDKMKALAWNAINAISPELAKLDEDKAYERIHGDEE